MKSKDSIISQNAAAELAGVSRAAISKLKNTRSFFTKTGKVDTDHPDWKSYLKEKQSAKDNAEKRETYRRSIKNPEDFNWINETPTTIQEEKIYADIISKKLDIEKDLENLIEKRIVKAAFGEIIKAIQSNNVDFGSRVSPRIAAKLGMVGTEKLIEPILNEEQKKAIGNVIAAAERAIRKL
jgi:hypothetical protein